MKERDTTSLYGPISVKSLGMVSSVGLNAASSCAAIRARISRFEELSFHDRATGQPIIGAPATEATPDRQGYRRLAPMLCRAIRECMTSLNPQLARTKGPPLLLVAIDDLERPDYPEDLPRRLLEDVQRTLGIQFPEESKVLAVGRTGFFRAVERARRLLNRLEIDSCIVAGVDSLLNGRALQWLESRDHLKTEDSPDGVIPGEAAAALCLTRPNNNGASMLDIVGLGFGDEASALREDAPNLAVGLADALRNALADARIPLHEIDFRVGGMTGDRLEFMEASSALARVQRVHKDKFELWVPAEKLGDVGAVLPACMVVVTAVGIKKGYAPGRSALLYASSNSSDRAACVVVAPKEGQYG